MHSLLEVKRLPNWVPLSGIFIEVSSHVGVLSQLPVIIFSHKKIRLFCRHHQYRK